MSEIEKLLKDIEKLKKKLELLIETKDSNLLDPDIIKASQSLDKAIAKYLQFIQDKI